MFLSSKFKLFDPPDQPQKQYTPKIIKLIYPFIYVIFAAGIVAQQDGGSIVKKIINT
jgi:hypothetical protein